MRPADEASAVATKADVVCVCVFSDEQVRSIAMEGGLVDCVPEGGVLVIHTTGSPGTAQAIAGAGAARGVGVIDSPVSGGPHDIAAGHITLLVGGADADLDRARPVLSAYGDPILHVGPLGAGQAVKLVNNAVFAANIGLVAQAVRLGEQLGVPEASLLAAPPARQRRQHGPDGRRGPRLGRHLRPDARRVPWQGRQGRPRGSRRPRARPSASSTPRSPSWRR